ncbi:2-isopropylmalate synthase [Vibrio mangrovi]|uniref:2-isopropylmalate synthase n=1 Tax=Vibrio mangrovi TaxID=474394 RepID=A0A1Y6ITW7_9VIBR|nr:2-isopropylmalate synthase [Vibrio mangrovi]MDW6004804.1 2-isopropylmalate synthase [Vibrio mangrovi]SMS01095.1 2-isopropylmalate synthase [Vibrio mangrovi]
MFDFRKYRAFEPIRLTDRTWPDQVITQAPGWCSVDLRDGNQALINPMDVAKKTRMFQLLVKLGFKEIEVGFPAASQPDFDFVRALIDNDLIPDDVSVQILTQAREELIARSFDALKGVKKAVVHVYNSTSTVQREQVFGKDREGIKAIAVQGARWVREYAELNPETEWAFQYSPESFTGTEMDYAVEVCNAVIQEWQPETGRRVILNLPATVEMSTPNIYADQIEYFCRSVNHRDQVEISLHTHNDRGCGVAAAELGVMAGADRIEGTLLGNGERTGNMDIVTMGMNLYSQGIDPELDFSDIQEIIEVVEYCTELPVSARHPWAGELVYTAFSGSHQDAIRKSMQYHEKHQLPHWQVAYLPIDPRDIGRDYEAVVRINSQSGKGGVALILERDHNISLPKWMHSEVSQVVQKATESSGAEITSQEIKAIFEQYFVTCNPQWMLEGYDVRTGQSKVAGEFRIPAIKPALYGEGHGIVEAFVNALEKRFGIEIRVTHLDESALSATTDAQAQACIALDVAGHRYCSVTTGEDTSAAVLQGVLTAFARSQLAQQIAA